MSDPKTTKNFSEFDANQIIQKIFNEAGMICTEGWVTGKVGRKITYSIVTTNVEDDTQRNEYVEDGVVLLVLDTVFTDGTRTSLSYVERVE